MKIEKYVPKVCDTCSYRECYIEEKKKCDECDIVNSSNYKLGSDIRREYKKAVEKAFRDYADNLYKYFDIYDTQTGEYGISLENLNKSLNDFIKGKRKG